MQKKIIALAIAGLSASTAFAADNVTLYGIADMYVGTANASYSNPAGSGSINRQSLVNSGGLATSRIGFKGVEDLGSGLKAVFTLEYGLAVDGNQAIGAGATTGTGARQQFVGLTGDFGTAVAGRLQTAAFDWAVAYDVLAGTAISPLQNLTSPAGAGALGITNAANFKTLIGGATVATRASNAIAYISPSFSGLTVAVNYSTNVIAGESFVSSSLSDNSNVKALLASVKYDNGPVSVGLVYAHANDDAASTNGSYGGAYDRADWALGASYNFGPAKLFGTYQQTKNQVSNIVSAAAPQADASDKTWSLGVAVPVSGAGTVVGSYASTKVNSATTATDSDVSARSYTLAYLHGLSKRTTLYTGYNHVSNGDLTGFIVNNNATQVTSTTSTLVGAPGGTTSNIFVAGINHKF